MCNVAVIMISIIITQVWCFFKRTDVFHLKQQVLAIRPEGVLLLRPSSIRFINDAV